MPRISSEFASFVRDTGVRAFDRLGERVKELDAPLRPILRAWNKLSPAQKSDLFDELMATVQGADQAPPKKSRKKAASKKSKW